MENVKIRINSFKIRAIRRKGRLQVSRYSNRLEERAGQRRREATLFEVQKEQHFVASFPVSGQFFFLWEKYESFLLPE
jgi:hypothetical protein